MAINTLFQNIADAIREKAGTSGLITPAQMPQAIADIQSGIEILSGTTDPTSEIGENGQLYIKYSIENNIALGNSLYAPPSYACNTQGETIATINGRWYRKYNSDGALVSVSRNEGWMQPITASQTPDGTQYIADSGGPWIYSNSYTINGVTWYFFSGQHGFYNPYSVVTSYPILNSFDFSTQAGAENFLQEMHVSNKAVSNLIVKAFVKKSGEWIDLYSAEITDVNTGG